MVKENGKFLKIYDLVLMIPKGKVATYGQIAHLAGMPGSARIVGYALHSLPQGSVIPWHRVINSKGKISQLPDPIIVEVQKQLLLSEGVEFNFKERVDLNKYLWKNQ